MIQGGDESRLAPDDWNCFNLAMICSRRFVSAFDIGGLPASVVAFPWIVCFSER